MIYYGRGEVTALLGVLKIGIKRGDTVYMIQQFSVYHRRYMEDYEIYRDVIMFAGKGMDNLEGTLLHKQNSVDIRNSKSIINSLNIDTIDYMKISGLIDWLHYNEFRTHTVQLNTTLHNAKNYINAVNDAVEIIKICKDKSVELDIKEEIQIQFVLTYQKDKQKK